MLPFPNPLETIDQSIDYVMHTRMLNFNRSVGITSRGYIGMFPGCTKVGDKVSLLQAQIFHWLRYARRAGSPWSLMGEKMDISVGG